MTLSFRLMVRYRSSRNDFGIIALFSVSDSDPFIRVHKFFVTVNTFAPKTGIPQFERTVRW